jgi:hypothetical protein
VSERPTPASSLHLRRLFLGLVGALAVFAALALAATTTASAATYSYDLAANTRVDVLGINAAADAKTAVLGDLRDGSALPSARAQGATTTPFAPVVATNTADDFANWGGEFVDDAIRAPATRPDFANISAKIERQMQTRGWTPDLIDEAVTSGNKYPAVNKLGGANTPATRYVSPTTGQSVVIDNATGEIIQVGGPGFKYGP